MLANPPPPTSDNVFLCSEISDTYVLPKGVRFLHMYSRSRFLEKIDTGSFHRWITGSISNLTVYYSKIIISIAPTFRSFLNKFASFIKVFKNF